VARSHSYKRGKSFPIAFAHFESYRRVSFRIRFLFGGPHGEFRFLPPVGFAPAYEALLPGRRLAISQCKAYGQLEKGCLLGPPSSSEQTVFVPNAVNTQNVSEVKSRFGCKEEGAFLGGIRSFSGSTQANDERPMF